jgi:hypothetical protein
MRPEAARRLIVGVGQIALVAATLVAWYSRVPPMLVALLALATGALVFVNYARWRGR